MVDPALVDFEWYIQAANGVLFAFVVFFVSAGLVLIVGDLVKGLKKKNDDTR
jgi:hypothetical protein